MFKPELTVMKDHKLPRRNFLKSTSTCLAGLSCITWPEVLAASHLSPLATPTIQEIVDLIISAVPGGIKNDTVDTFKSGDPSQPCTGIVTTFMATAEVIKKAADLGANFIITHEPTYYNHLDEVDWLKDDPVYNFKKTLIEKNGITIWRFHDYWHTVQPDGILHGLIESLGWEQYEIKNQKVITIPQTTVRELAVFFKEKMGLIRPFIVGDPNMICGSVALLPGAWGGKNQINFLSSEQFDVMVVGEVAEWETSEYIRDATFGGIKRSLIILGHAVSEEPGMEYLVEWLKLKVSEIPIHHVAAQEAFIPV